MPFHLVDDVYIIYIDHYPQIKVNTSESCFIERSLIRESFDRISNFQESWNSENWKLEIQHLTGKKHQERDFLEFWNFEQWEILILDKND